jgi:ribonuclease VapC
MVIDTSAMVAVALGEPDREWLLDALRREPSRLISAVSLLELGMVLRTRLGPSGAKLGSELAGQMATEIIPFDEIQARLALSAFERFGKGMGHKAQLNFGDCAVYGLAVYRGDTILAIGNDFAATDVPVWRPSRRT